MIRYTLPDRPCCTTTLRPDANGQWVLFDDTQAQRERIEQLETDARGYHTRIEQLDAQLAAMTQERDGQAIRIDALRTHLSSTIAERDRLKEALRFYADPQTYGISGGSVDRIIQDAGKRAKAALRGETGGA